MRDRYRMPAFVALSFASHMLLGYGLLAMPRHTTSVVPVSVLTIRETPRVPPSAPPPLEEPPKPPEPKKQPIHEAPRHKPAAVPPDAPREAVPGEAPPTERQAAGGVSTTPVFGVSMESTTTAGNGPAVPIGNTLLADPKRATAGPSKVAALAAPAKAYEVTKMPLPKGRCSGEYTDEARQAGIEGTVVLDLVVGEDGAVRDITIVRGLSHGLTEAATAAARRCRFTPGERDGLPVPVRVRGFKITFYLQGGG